MPKTPKLSFGLLALAMTVAACATSQTRAIAVAAVPTSTQDVAPLAAPSTPRVRVPGVLTRADIEEFVAHGLGSFLARIDVSPVLDHGRFMGFRLDRADDLESWRAGGADIRVGDVVRRINGISIERPEQAMWAFARLRVSDAVEVVLRRGADEITVRQPIVDVPRNATAALRPAPARQE